MEGWEGHVGVSVSSGLWLIISATMGVTDTGEKFLDDDFGSFGLTKGTFDEFLNIKMRF